jgi:hypothetical protein
VLLTISRYRSFIHLMDRSHLLLSTRARQRSAELGKPVLVMRDSGRTA